jgi:hypothetical protein
MGPTFDPDLTLTFTLKLALFFFEYVTFHPATPTVTLTQAVLDLSEEQEQRMIDAHADMMSRLSAIFAKHQMVLMGVNDHQRGPAAYSDGIGTTTVQWSVRI